MNITLIRFTNRVTNMIIKRNNHSLSSLEIQEFYQEKNNLETKPKMEIRNFNKKMKNENENKNENKMKNKIKK